VLKKIIAQRAYVPLFLLLLLSACGSAPVQLQPIVSPNDDNSYRLLSLDNGLQVLLVSDPQSSKAAASLDVLVGSGDNPPDRGGLAHFLEHMLFLGTDKYPDPAEYERYITEHGGSRNAYTSFEHTNYFFDIDEAFLPEALDRFAQFFIAPRFDAQYVDREKNAVQAEYQMGLKSDGRRGLDVLQTTMNSEHPFSQFAVGSLETLADRAGATVRDDLLAFYKRHYSANMMRLAVYGSQDLDTLQALVVPLFQQLPNNNFQHQAIEAPLFSADTLPMFVTVKPQASQRQLEISFPTRDYRGNYQSKPRSYVGSLVGHEGKGSLLSQLKQEGLAEGLGAGSGLAWRGGSLFNITISLTEKGVGEHQRVLQLVFAYLDMLRNAGAGQRLFDEQARLAELAFRFREDQGAMHSVSALSAGMHYYNALDVLRGSYIMEDYQPALIEGLLQALRPDNARITLTDGSVSTDRVSDHYKVPFGQRRVAAAELSGWRAPPEETLFELPGPNPYIASDVAVKELGEEGNDDPRLMLEQHRLKVWFSQDSEFRIPRGATYVNFKSPMVSRSPGTTAAALLYVALLKDGVNEYTYPALLAGLSFDLYKHSQGLTLRISGYNDKQALLLESLVQDFAAATFNPDRFDNIRHDIIRNLRNAKASPPYRQVLSELRRAMQYGRYSEQQLIAALESTDMAKLDGFVRELWQDARAEVMIYGNYEPAAAERVARIVQPLLSPQPVTPMPAMQVVKLEADSQLLYAVDVPHDDVVVAWYLQGEGDSWRDRALTALTAQIMKSGFFQELRTEQQLGYVVSTYYYPHVDVPGLLMLVQSPGADAETVSTAMAAFKQRLPERIEAEQFVRHQQALISEILEPDKNLWERAEYYWQSIARKQFDFASRNTLANAVKALNQTDWESYFGRVFLKQPASLQVVAAGKVNVLPKGGASVVTSAEQIQQTHDSYTVH